MKIKSIKLKNHKTLGDLSLDFTDKDGNVLDTILFAGENGSGKSQVLNLIYNFSEFRLEHNYPENEEREIVIQLSKADFEILNQYKDSKEEFSDGILNNELTFSYDYSITNNWGQIKITYKNQNSESREIHGGYFGNKPELKNLFKSVFSDVEINFSSGNVQSVTSQDVDQKILNSIRSSPNLATEITQLLVDVQALDDAEFTEWGRENIGKVVDHTKLDSRMGRFKEAFSFMFPNKKYKKIKNENGKQVIFEEYGKEVSIKDLSSGEKQIIFRGSFLLKDKKSNNGAMVLIDEPEISLHPKWQLKILEFYKRLFTDDKGVQTSQIFFATHSPFIIHNDGRLNDKVIVLKRDTNGNILTPEKAEYYGWTSEKTILEAFNIELGDRKRPVILTEGKTDMSILKTAWSKLNPEKEIPWDIIPSGIEVKEDERSGCAEFVRRSLELVANLSHTQVIVGLFDNDREGNEQFKGLNKKIFKDFTEESTKKHEAKNIYGTLLPVPDVRKFFVTENNPNQRYLVIEHLFSDEILSKYNMKGESILGTDIFEIKGDKSKFAEEVNNFSIESFENFKIVFELFDKLTKS